MYLFKTFSKFSFILILLFSCTNEWEKAYFDICDKPEDILFNDEQVIITNSGINQGNVTVVSSVDTVVMQNALIHNPKGLALFKNDILGVSDSFIFRCNVEDQELQIIDTISGSSGLNDIAVYNEIIAISDLVGNKVYIKMPSAPLITLDINKPNGLLFLKEGELIIGTFNKSNSDLIFYNLFDRKEHRISVPFSVDGLDLVNGQLLVGSYNGALYKLELRNKRDLVLLSKKRGYNFCDLTVNENKVYVPSNNQNEILVYTFSESI